MTSYANLVSRILQFKPIEEAVNNLLQRDPTLVNLLTPEWETVLNNNEVFKTWNSGNVSLSPAKRRRLNDPYEMAYLHADDNDFKFLIAGYFMYSPSTEDKPPKLRYVRGCPMINTIGKVIASARDKTNFPTMNVYPVTCNVHCPACNKDLRKMSRNNIYCSKAFLMFNGEAIESSGSHVLDKFHTYSEFIAIAALRITSIVIFGTNLKLSASCDFFLMTPDYALLPPNPYKPFELDNIGLDEEKVVEEEKKKEEEEVELQLPNFIVSTKKVVN